jgi:hypothetical protein
MEAMRAAFYRVCDILQLSCDQEDPLTEVVVTKIVELAKAGESDPEFCVSTCWPNGNLITGHDTARASAVRIPAGDACRLGKTDGPGASATTVGVAWPHRRPRQLS